MENFVDHIRQADDSVTEHRRASDDIIMELLNIVQRLDKKFEDHMLEEQVKSDINQRKFEEIVAKAFPEGDLDTHRKTHVSFIHFIKTVFKYAKNKT